MPLRSQRVSLACHVPHVPLQWRSPSKEPRKKLENRAEHDNRANKSEANDGPTDKESNVYLGAGW